MKTLYLCGGGNPEGVRLALSINKDQARWDRVVVLDDDPSKHGTKVLGVEVVGPFSMLEDADPENSEVANLVARTTVKRRAAGLKIAHFGVPTATLLHPSVDVDGAEIAQDVIAYQNSTIGPGASIGDGSVLFMGAAAGHGCRVGRFCVLAPNAVLNARVHVGDGVYVGTGAAVLPELTIGQWATVGACSAVIRDVPAGATVMGVPAETILTLEEMPSDALPEAERGAIGTLPRTSTGEVDRQASPVRESGRPDPGQSIGAPESELETSLSRLWEELLGRSQVGLDDNFFDLGGQSLLAMQLHSRIRASIDASFRVTDIFRFPTVRTLAAHLGGSQERSPASERGRERAEARRDAIARRRTHRRE